MNKICFVLIFCLCVSFSASADSGFEYQLDIKKRTGIYSDISLSFDQVIIDITRLNPLDDSDAQDERVKALFSKGVELWQSEGAKQSYMLASQYGYKKLCDAVVAYYNSVGRVYKSVPYLRSLVDDSARIYLVDVQADASIRLIDVYLTLGQTEAAKELLAELKGMMDEFFTIEVGNMSEVDPYTLVLHAEYQKAIIKIALLEGNSYELVKEEQAFFDFLMQAYDKFFYMPFMQFAGVMSSENAFVQYSENNIANENYYTNYEAMYNFARFFAANGDRERALIALSEAEKAVKANGSGDLSILGKNNIPTKEIRRAGGTTSTDSNVVQRVSIRFKYLSYLYRTVVLSELGDFDKASLELNNTNNYYQEMQKYYSELPAEYAYLDKINDDFPQQLLSQARIAKGRMNFADADKTYSNLISYYEKVRASLPLKLRRGFFRGYAKGAYLGLIESRAHMFMVKRSDKSYEKFLDAVEMMNARQFRELRGQQVVSNIKSIQASLDDDDLIYMIIDSENAVLTAGITKDNKGITIVPKDNGLENALHAFKKGLINQNIYDIDKLAKLSSQIIEPIGVYKKKGKLHVIIDGVVSILPLDIYPINGKMLFENYEVDYMVTLNALQKGKSDERLSFLGIADPVYDSRPKEISQVQVSMKRSAAIAGYFAPLPETRDEVKAVAAGMAVADLLLGNDASESVIKSMPLDKYSVIHFATHGILGGELPDMDEPALVLSGEQGEDSLLTASEISNLKLNSSLVVLSACNTGSGKYFRGEGVTGIARAFKLAGADTVIASLWTVDSMATKSLMELLYKNIAEGQTVSDALYNAKKMLQTEAGENDSSERALKSKTITQKEFKGYGNPYYWSAFVIIRS